MLSPFDGDTEQSMLRILELFAQSHSEKLAKNEDLTQDIDS